MAAVGAEQRSRWMTAAASLRTAGNLRQRFRVQRRGARASAEALYERAKTHGPIGNYRALASWRRARLRRF